VLDCKTRPRYFLFVFFLTQDARLQDPTPLFCWGGRRRISADGKSIEFDSLGWCNNPKSPNYRKTTGPKGGMKMVWEKWSEIPA
jgi:hypothetical protein